MLTDAQPSPQAIGRYDTNKIPFTKGYFATFPTSPPHTPMESMTGVGALDKWYVFGIIT
ncbi:hypothetical protein [Devosia naphthalenivorans]|uniref:hypothetical protein n=1 Tax=Devosia naphthalenivorans TaxID=2082392 RepID=UPI0013B0560D|nr:hypothetical protein [Devosia naphthalenivorans]